MYEHLSTIKGAKPYLASRYDHMIVVYYSRSNKQLPLPPTIYSLYYTI